MNGYPGRERSPSLETDRHPSTRAVGVCPKGSLRDREELATPFRLREHPAIGSHSQAGSPGDSQHEPRPHNTDAPGAGWDIQQEGQQEGNDNAQNDKEDSVSEMGSSGGDKL